MTQTATKLELTIKDTTYIIASKEDIIAIHDSGATVRVFNKARREFLYAAATKGAV